MSFKALEDDSILTADNLINEMESWVRALNSPNDDHHFRFIDLTGKTALTFRFNFGERIGIRATLQSILTFLNQPQPQNSSQSTTRPRRSQTLFGPALKPHFDLTRLQEITNTKIRQCLQRASIETDQEFFILRSDVADYPYTLIIQCPQCHHEVPVKITSDYHNGHYVANFRAYIFKDHYEKHFE